MIPPSLSRLLAPVTAAALLAGCATVPGQYRLAERDPLEKANRVVWGVNRAADKVVIKPVTQVYRAVAPAPVRQGFSNFFNNLAEPWSAINNLLQGKPKRAGDNLARFVVNTTIGIGGLFDHATKMGIQPQYEDLGQTLAVWGVNGGPYLVLPLLGPSSMRDGIGSGVSFYADPINVAIQQSSLSRWTKRGYRVAYVIDARSDLIETGGDAFLESSLDPYATARSAYLQRRTAAIADAEDSLDAGPPDDPASMDAAGPPDPQAPIEATPTSPAPSAPTPPAPEGVAKTPEQSAGTPPPEPVAPPRP